MKVHFTPADLVSLSDRDLQVHILIELNAIRGMLQDVLETPVPTAEAPAPCPHPAPGRHDHSAMGQPPWTHFFCSTCGEWVSGGQVRGPEAVIR